MPRCIFWLFALLFSGCVTVYHPLVSLQRPAVINPELRNFDGVHLMVRCLPTDYTDSGDSEILCQNLRTLFEVQGAKVEVEVPESDLPAHDPAEGTPDLVIELSSKQMHSENSALQWALCYASFTLIPAVTEATFAQDVVLRDAEGFLLANDVLQGRFVRYFGIGFWAINGFMDLVFRPKEEQLTGSAAKTDFSRDFYGQLSQLAFQARMRSAVLHGFDQVASTAPPPPIKPIVPRPAPSKKTNTAPDSEWALPPKSTK